MFSLNNLLVFVELKNPKRQFYFIISQFVIKEKKNIWYWSGGPTEYDRLRVKELIKWNGIQGNFSKSLEFKLLWS